MALILPKGIVVNSAEIEGSIERIDDEPLDPADIAKFWKVYTTTRRRLLDPTAERLENYWWRIWGSQRRELNGVTVARLFALISDGHSFVPLRGPANRDEGTPPSIKESRNGLGASSAINFQQPSNSRPSTTSSSTTSKGPAVMPHPILKKTRGPSTTGPRPTARFISPHESENETNSPVSPNSHVVVQPPSPSPDSQDHKTDKKTSSGSGKSKGFVASTASKKKRPVIVRRKSSQSSTECATKPGDNQPPGPSSSSEKSPPTFAEATQSRARTNSQSKFQENLSPSPEKSSKKRSQSKLGDSKKGEILRATLGTRRERIVMASGHEPRSNGDPGPSTLRSVENRQTSEELLSGEELEQLEMQNILLAEANARMQEKATPSAQGRQSSDPSLGASQNLRSSNRSASEGNLGMGASRYLSNDSKGIASLAPTLSAATGELGLGDDGLGHGPRTALQTGGKGKGRRSEDLFAKISVQSVAGSSSAAAATPSSLARSKSQLTLLLEKDRARSSEHKPKEDKKKGRKG